ncbi:MAG: precorrin-4 C(11)-methyltransferase [Pseudomonadota bacterium]
MKVIFVGSGPGSPDLLTVRGARVIEQCRVCVYAGSLVNPEILEMIPDSAEKHDSSKLNLDEIINIFEDAMRRNIDVVRLHSGDPSIFGAIREQMERLDRLKIEYEVIPGVSSFQATAAALKIELTAPEISQTIILTRTVGKTPMPEGQDLERLAGVQATLCVFLSVDKIDDVAARLKKTYGPDCPAAVVRRVSWPDQLIVTGTLSDIASKTRAARITKTAMILVGPALGKNLPVSKLYDARFSHEFRTSID